MGQHPGDDLTGGRHTLLGGWLPSTAAMLVSHLSLYAVLLVSLRHVKASDAEVAWVQVLAFFAFARLLTVDWLPDGRLLIVSAREGRLLRREPDGSLVPHADLSGLAGPGHPWNEIVVDGRGNAYINNQGFEFPGGTFAPGTIALLTPDGSARLVADGIAFPNGMAVTPDNQTLLVAESYGNKLTAFGIAADGGLSQGRVWAELDGGVPDGICLDAEGAVWYADVPNKRCVRVREGGQVLRTIDLDRGCFACMLGGADRKTLFLVATEWRDTEGPPTGQVLMVAAPAPGAGWP
jgi:sugar lactone lactonase YvrE